MLRRVWIASSAGIWVGWLAGLATALADFGAHWLFMESAGDRVTLLVRLLSLQPAFGAVLGGCAGLWVGLGVPLSAAVARRARLEAVAGPDGDAALAPNTRKASLFEAAALTVWCLLPLLAPISALSRLLFTGGKMSRLSGQPVWIALTLLIASALSLGGLAALLWYATWLKRASSARAHRSLAVIAGLALLFGKLNQHILPNLYDYLHALLSALAFACFAIVFGGLGGKLLQRRRERLPAWSGVILLLPLLAAARTGLHQLDQNQNVRVALLSANMPHSRSLMLGLGPFLPTVDRESAALAQLRAAAARKRRAERNHVTNLPVLEEAHVLLITVDALRADRLGVHGNARGLTSELDALARRSVTFERAYAQAPHSSYSLCSLMTSEYLHETLELGQPPPQATLPRVLAEAGYHGAAFYTQGIFHTAGAQLKLYQEDAFGFAFHEHQDRPAEEMTDRVLAEIDRTLARQEPSTLFWVHYFDVHEPYEATTLGDSDVDRYDSEILATDRAIGRLVREAERRLKKPLVVVITADHGEEFHEHGGVYHGSSLYDEQVRVPLILLAPNLPAARVSSPVESIDVAPTLLGLLGVEVPAGMRGHDLRALALGRNAPRGPVFSAVIHKKMVVSWPYKLIADLRFGLFELYDLERDPGERDNRADQDPSRLQSLRGEVYAWLDSLAAKTETAQPSERDRALEWGRLGDRRAVHPLSELMLDEQASDAARSEAARLLGKLADPLATESLVAATHVGRRWVAAEAAIALGRLFDPRAAPTLRQLISAEDPALRSRAAVSLGRLRDRAAVPSLIDALWVAPSDYEREEAVRWLGRLGDPRALDPLINLLAEANVRHLVVLALGELGDARAFAPLLDVLTWDRNTNVRDGVVRGLAMLGDSRALSVIWPLVGDDPALRNPGEALVRLGALEGQLIGGADVQRAGGGSSGFGACHIGPLRHDWDFLRRTYCSTRASDASFRVRVPAAVAQATQGTVVLFSVRRIDAVQTTQLDVSIGDRKLPSMRVDGAWTEQRWSLPAAALSSGELRVTVHGVDPGVRLDVDHLLIVPRHVTDG